MKKILGLLLFTAYFSNAIAQSLSVEDMTRLYSMDFQHMKKYLGSKQFLPYGQSIDTFENANIGYSNLFIYESRINNEFVYEIVTITDIPGSNRFILYQSNSKSIFGEAFKYVKAQGLDFIKILKSKDMGIAYFFAGTPWHIAIRKMKLANEKNRDPLFIISLSANQNNPECALANLNKQ
ncbi:MAG TPA: hypothetical protein VGO09_09175 [Flavisolibacter sp.]|nr:hypothetical protein [Flavisolibacter sp.]